MPDFDEMTDEQATEIGNRLIALLDLEVDNYGRVYTMWGRKTPCGIVRSVLKVAVESMRDDTSRAVLALKK